MTDTTAYYVPLTYYVPYNIPLLYVIFVCVAHQSSSSCCSEAMLRLISWTPQTIKLWDFMQLCDIVRGIEKAIIVIYPFLFDGILCDV